jgi:D-3-phosphoglycerate dehydrogenase
MLEKKIKVLLLENIHPVARESLESAGLVVNVRSDSPGEKELIEQLQEYDLLGIRSKTQVTGPILKANPQLLGIGAFCIGTNQVDLQEANLKGIPVFNAPHSNTRSVAEMVIAEVICLARQLGDRNSLAHQGRWHKSAEGSHEVRGKTLGIVGYGHIGSQVSVLAESLGMKVIFFDVIKKLPLGNARACQGLEELLRSADFVTLHVPETPQTKNMISRTELEQMRAGSFLLNASRGTVVVIEDLVNALRSKKLGGCAIDVFPEEPASNKEKFLSPLQGLDNVLLTPHIGGSTEEAQKAIGFEVAASFLRFLQIGSTSGAVNFPQVDLPPQEGAQRILNVHRNEPGVLGEVNGVVSQMGANIRAQYLATDSRIGYLVMDIENVTGFSLAQKIESLPRSIKTRVVY